MGRMASWAPANRDLRMFQGSVTKKLKGSVKKPVFFGTFSKKFFGPRLVSTPLATRTSRFSLNRPLLGPRPTRPPGTGQDLIRRGLRKQDLPSEADAIVIGAGGEGPAPGRRSPRKSWHSFPPATWAKVECLAVAKLETGRNTMRGEGGDVIPISFSWRICAALVPDWVHRHYGVGITDAH